MAKLDKRPGIDPRMLEEAMNIAELVTQEEYTDKYKNNFTSYYFIAGALAAALYLLEEMYNGETDD